MRLAVLMSCALLSACAARLGGDALSCPPGAFPGRTAELLFGRNIAGAPGVDDAEWEGFVAAEIAPRFSGFTVLDGLGQWTGAAGVEREESKLVLIVVPDEPDTQARIEAVRDAYKTRFEQEAVLLILHSACVGF